MSSGSSGSELAHVAAELRGPDGPLEMIATAGVIGGFCSVELALFGWLGRAAPSCASPGEVAWASAASLRAAWRASQLETLMPVSVGLTPTGALVPPRPTLVACLAALADDRPSDRHGMVSEEALAWYEVLAEAYRFRLECRSKAADGPLERVLGRVMADLQAERTVARRFAKPPGRDA